MMAAWFACAEPRARLTIWLDESLGGQFDETDRGARRRQSLGSRARPDPRAIEQDRQRGMPSGHYVAKLP